MAQPCLPEFRHQFLRMPPHQFQRFGAFCRNDHLCPIRSLRDFNPQLAQFLWRKANLDPIALFRRVTKTVQDLRHNWRRDPQLRRHFRGGQVRGGNSRE